MGSHHPIASQETVGIICHPDPLAGQDWFVQPLGSGGTMADPSLEVRCTTVGSSRDQGQIMRTDSITALSISASFSFHLLRGLASLFILDEPFDLNPFSL